VPFPSLNAWPHVVARVVIAMCALALLASTVMVATPPASANSLGSQISTSRQGQAYAESQMRAQDRAIVRLMAQAKQVRKAVKVSNRDLKRGKRALALVKKIVQTRRERLRRVSNLYDDPAEIPQAWKYERKLRGLRKGLRVAESRKKSIGRRVRTMSWSRNARQAKLRSLKRARRVAVGRREAAEGALGYRIVQMTNLAAARVRQQSAVSLSAGGGSFSWPSTGRISQTYGCTGFYLSPRRGSCAHFHDGLDIVDGHGTPVRAVAVGVVAYAGWNPWDESGRAWIIVVAHPNGFVTRYGHMTPTKRVRVGELVHTGQVIGKMGNTGRSTGTHLHFELLKGKSDVNPLHYLPSGVVKIKIDKTSTKKGRAQAARKDRQKARKVAKRAAAKARKAAKASKLPVVTLGDADPACGPESDQSGGDVPAAAGVFGYSFAAAVRESGNDASIDCEPAQSSATGPVPRGARDSQVNWEPQAGSQPAATRDARDGESDPGVRLPFRGTSPIPA
jgi:murein DD-endopeptidase MepM/ murein hydrolase activator NlpD